MTMAAVGTGMAGCSFSVSTGNNMAANTAKPANTATNAPSNTASNSAKKDDKPKAKLADEKKPTDSKAKTVKNNPVPDSWIYIYDEAKSYGFSVPEGTTDGIDVFTATTPAPNEIEIFVLAYKDKSLTKEDLLDHAVKFLEGLGVKVTPGTLKGESDDYAVADATTVDDKGNKEKQRILVGTDVSDNYVMILNAPEAKFAADEKTIDEIWGSFEIWSGGASQN